MVIRLEVHVDARRVEPLMIDGGGTYVAVAVPGGDTQETKAT
jgi:hypothetical protein